MSVLNLELKRYVDDSYDIEIGYCLQNRLVADLKAGLLKKIGKIAIITDSNVLCLYAMPIANLLRDNGFAVEVFSFPAGEASKTREMKAKIEDEMLAAGLRRDIAVIAVGGGVVTDLAGFIAGTYARGVPFINYATTMLAAADASVGGKTAVDTPLATNLIGLFNQPKKVYVDVACWQTLPLREVACGVAETVKHACLADAAFFDYLEKNIEKIYAFDEEVCSYVAHRNCEIKYGVVMRDERESGLREVLNLGHTVGRAVETESKYRLLHGEAVAIGLVAQARLACARGYMDENEVARLIGLLEKASLPVVIPDYIDKPSLAERLYTDKKVRRGKLRFVLQRKIGAVVQFGENNFATEVERSEIVKIIENM